MSHYKSFIIHLERSTGRQAQVRDIIAKSPFDSEIVDAVDGSKLSKEEMEVCSSQASFHKPNYPFGLNPGEIGCFLSHRSTWQKIVDQDLTAGLVLEDDVQIDSEVFEPGLMAAKKWSQDYGYIQFQRRGLSSRFPMVESDGDVKLLCPVPALVRASAQLISQSAAKRLLELTTRFDRPVDTFIQMFWITGIQPVCIFPSGVSDRTEETGGSSLSIKQPLNAKLVREWKRFNYRQKIARLSRNN